jgi:hypothetical protein
MELRPGAELVSHEVVAVDTADAFAYEHVYRVRELVFLKDNPFAATPDTVPTTMGELLTANLEKITGTNDDGNEFTSWVEYRFMGKVVHRSVDVKLKKSAAFSAAAVGGV